MILLCILRVQHSPWNTGKVNPYWIEFSRLCWSQRHLWTPLFYENSSMIQVLKNKDSPKTMFIHDSLSLWWFSIKLQKQSQTCNMMLIRAVVLGIHKNYWGKSWCQDPCNSAGQKKVAQHILRSMQLWGLQLLKGWLEHVKDLLSSLSFYFIRKGKNQINLCLACLSRWPLNFLSHVY